MKRNKKQVRKEAEGLVNVSLQLLEENRFEEALFNLNQSLVTLPNYADALYNVAVVSYNKAEQLRTPNTKAAPAPTLPPCPHLGSGTFKVVDNERYMIEQAITALTNVIKNDTSKRGETTGLAHRFLANIKTEYIEVLIMPPLVVNIDSRGDIYDSIYHTSREDLLSVVEVHYLSALSILVTSKEQDSYIFEYAQFLCFGANESIKIHKLKRGRCESVSSPAALLAGDLEFVVMFLNQMKKTCSTLDSALQTPYSTHIDRDIICAYGRVLCDMWDFLLEFPLLSAKNGFIPSPSDPSDPSDQNISHPLLQLLQSSAEIAFDTSFVSTTVRVAKSISALNGRSEGDKDTPDEATSADLWVHLVTWSRINGQTERFSEAMHMLAVELWSLVGSCRSPAEGVQQDNSYHTELLASLGDLFARVTAEVTAVVSAASTSITSTATTSTSPIDFTNTIASNDNETQSRFICESVIRVVQQCIPSVFFAHIIQCVGTLEEYVATIAQTGEDGVVRMDGVLSPSHSTCICMWRQMLLECDLNSEYIVAYAPPIFLTISRMCYVLSLWRLLRENVTKIGTQGKVKASCEDLYFTDLVVGERNREKLQELNDVYYNYSCTSWRVGDQMSCEAALQKCLILERCIRALEESLPNSTNNGINRFSGGDSCSSRSISSSSSSCSSSGGIAAGNSGGSFSGTLTGSTTRLYRDIAADADFRGIETTPWFIVLFT